MDLSVVLVNYNTSGLCRQAVDAVLSTAREVSFEILVADNSSNPAERFTHPDNRVRVLSGLANKGFGNACNLGAAKARGDFLLFLNSDAIVQEGTLDRSVAYLRRHPGVSLLGVRTYLPDGSFDHGCKRGFPTPLNAFYYFFGFDRRHPGSQKYGGYRLDYLPVDKTHEVDAVSGAFLMIRRPLFEALGGFDESFFMYGEDLDLCYRAQQANAKTVYFADAALLHLKGQSGLAACDPQVIRWFYGAMQIFYRKHYQKRYPLVVSLAVYAAIFLKHGWALLAGRVHR